MLQQLHGSGKTAVLVERMISKVINDKVDIDKILIVTFTNAAASEMRERILDAIYKKIDENPEEENLQKQIILLNKASICTIHSFCLDVIRNHFYELDIPANFRVGDTAEIELLKQEVLEEIFEEKYINNESSFVELINAYTNYRDDENLKELIMSIFKFIQSSPFPKEWLKEKVDMFNICDKNQDFSYTIWGKILLKNLEENLEDSILKLENLIYDMKRFEELEKYIRVVENDICELRSLKKNLNLWDNAYNASKIVWEKWPADRKITIQMKDEAKKIRDDVKKKLTASIDKILIYNSEMANDDILEMHHILKSLEKIIIEFSDRFTKRKREKNIIDFNDIEHFALKLLVSKDENGKIISTNIAKEYQEKFEEIAIDEYQDSNLVQEYILNSISKGNNIFMVGDVKQSIYKFRQARPELFLEKYENYSVNKEENKDLKIKLFKNFRSRENILDITNLVFENIMCKEAGDINYNKEEYLNLGANYEPPEEDLEFAGISELHIIDLKEDDCENENIICDENDDTSEENNKIIENSTIEAKFVARKIKELLESNYMVLDKKEGYRKITYKDIVILLRATSSLAPIYEKEMVELDIPVFSDTSSEFLDSIEIQTILSLLKIMDNPIQDIPLISILRSSIGGFSDDELVKIRICNRDECFYKAMIQAKIQVDEVLKNKITNFLNNLKKWQSQINEKPLDELIWNIYMETNYYNYVGLMSNGALRQANLKMLFERAKQYEKASFKGLFNFINFIDKLKSSNGDMTSAKLIGENENVVRIMSIHKSKGLEFPVVFLSNSGKGFNLQDLNDTILMHQDIGLGPKYINYDQRMEYNTLAKEAIRLNSYSETLSEEMRILYVALTRAREKLIITGLRKDAKKVLEDKERLIELYSKLEANSNKINPLLTKKYKTYLDWMELVYLKNKDKIENILKLEIHKKDEILKAEVKKDEKNVVDVIKEIKEEVKKIGNEQFEIIKNINWKYAYKESTKIPTKTSVTKLKDLKDEDIVSIDEINELKEKMEILTEIPKFMQEEEKISSAKKGTLIHLCIQKMNEKEEYSKEKIKELVDNLYKKNIITKLEREAINIESLYRYTKSELWKDLKFAKKISKEQAFYINIKAKKAIQIESNENILVQGIIDLYFIDKDDKLVLVDYKTDYIVEGEEEILIEKYSKQLEIYKEALEKSLQMKVEKVYIFSTRLNKKIELKI